MKNLSVSTKLLSGFSVVAVLTVIVGAAGVFSMRSMDSSYSEAINLHAIPIVKMAQGLSDLQNTAVDLRNAVIYIDDQDKLRDIVSSTRSDMRLFEDEMAEYSKSIVQPAAMEIFTGAMKIYNDTYKPALLGLFDMTRTDLDKAKVEEVLALTKHATDEMVGMFNTLMKAKVGLLDKANQDNTALSSTFFAIILAGAVISSVLALFLGFYISGLISKPLLPLSAFMEKAGSTGNITITQEDIETIGKYQHRKDEIGMTIKGAASLINHITNIAQELETVASGDLTVDIKLLSEEDTMGKSLENMVNSLNNMFGEINSISAQVSSDAKQVAETSESIAGGASQMAEGAQSLAEGATKQAEHVHEVSHSIDDITEKTKANANMANQAAKLSDAIIVKAEKGGRQMDEMISAIKGVTEASESVSNIMSTISGIAEQTNLLALNAAIEAARAGQFGKGFAVVAEEVRKLAVQSEEAVKETSSIIHNSMEKADLGARVADEMALSLTEIISGINESSRLIMEIARASGDQAEGIAQINANVNKVADVIQNNSAVAQENAATSQESSAAAQVSAVSSEKMTVNADILESLIAQFKLKEVDLEPVKSAQKTGTNRSRSKSLHSNQHSFMLNSPTTSVA